MPIQKLDAAFCLVAQCESGKRKTDYYDPTVRGFVLECRASGGKTYYLRYDQDGRQKQHKIAAYGDITFDKAKKEAVRLRSQVTLGGDPAAAKKERRAVPLYGELADQHVAHARTYMRSIKTLEGYMKRIKARWGRTRLTDIKQQDIAAWLAELRTQGLAPATIEKTRVTFGRSFELAAQWQIPGADRNPVRGIPRPRFSNARERYVTSEEAQRLFDAATKSRNLQLGAIIKLLLLTGARKSELLAARWANVDIERRTWLIPMSKTGKARHVPLSQAAIDVIAGIRRATGAVFLFPSPKAPGKPLGCIKHGWDAVRSAAGLNDLRIHDLRHSAASFMVNSGVDLFAVGKVLGHASYQSTQRYSHLANDTLLAAVEAGAAKLTSRPVAESSSPHLPRAGVGSLLNFPPEGHHTIEGITMNDLSPRTSYAPDLIVPTPPMQLLTRDGQGAANAAMFRRLRQLKRACRPRTDKNSIAIVLITACLEEGLKTRRRIAGALACLDLPWQRVADTLRRETPSRWTLNDDDTYSLVDEGTLNS